jgi:hypothetical protein
MSPHDTGRLRAKRQLAWGAQREDRVLAGVLDACERREGRRRAVVWAAAALLAALFVRALPPARLAVGATSTPPGASALDRTASGSTLSADGGKQRGLGGFAGTGAESSRVKRAIGGSGGNAGTG